MKDVQTDVAFLPVGGTYTMDYKEAAQAVELIDPEYAVPMHYGSVVGSASDAAKFVELVGDRGVIIPPQS
jgi:L-ascorbate metabolism protein UlaG (beta-lactamase superfamily)